MKALWFGFGIAVVAALIFCVTIIFLAHVFFWFMSDIFKRAKSKLSFFYKKQTINSFTEQSSEDAWWWAIR